MKTNEELQKILQGIWNSWQEEGTTVGEMTALVDALRSQINNIALNKPRISPEPSKNEEKVKK